MHLFGHMHQTDYRTSSTGGRKLERTWQGLSLFGEEIWEGGVERRFGYAAGRITLKDRVGELRIWPRKAQPPEGGRWKFIPDHDRCNLDENVNSTFPETLELHRQVIPLAAGATSISSLSPLSATEGMPTTFTILGNNLPDQLQLYIPNCTVSTSTSGSSTRRSLTCTPLIAGRFIAQIKDNKGGTLLQTYVVNVIAAASPQRGSAPPQRTQEPPVGYSSMPVGYPQQLPQSPVQPAYPQPQAPLGLPTFRSPVVGPLYRDGDDSPLLVPVSSSKALLLKIMASMPEDLFVGSKFINEKLPGYEALVPLGVTTLERLLEELAIAELVDRGPQSAYGLKMYRHKPLASSVEHTKDRTMVPEAVAGQAANPVGERQHETMVVTSQKIAHRVRALLTGPDGKGDGYNDAAAEEAMAAVIKPALVRIAELRQEKTPLGVATQDHYRHKHALTFGHPDGGPKGVWRHGGHQSVFECSVWLTVDGGPRAERLEFFLSHFDFRHGDSKVSLDAPNFVDAVATLLSKSVESRDVE